MTRNPDAARQRSIYMRPSLWAEARVAARRRGQGSASRYISWLVAHDTAYLAAHIATIAVAKGVFK